MVGQTQRIPKFCERQRAENLVNSPANPVFQRYGDTLPCMGKVFAG